MVYLLRSRCPNYFRRYGNPPQSSKLRMTTKSVRTSDIQVSQSVVRQLLKKHGYRRRKAQKKCTMKHRNEQFENIARLKAEYDAAGHPNIRLDTKTKEDLGKSCTSMTMISRALPKGWSSPMVSTMCGVTSATCTWEPAMIPVHSPVIAFATGGIPMGKSTIGRPPPFWCCVMAGEQQRSALPL